VVVTFEQIVQPYLISPCRWRKPSEGGAMCCFRSG